MRCGSSSTALGRGNGGRLTLVDGAMFVWFGEIGVGVGRYPGQGCGPIALVQAVSAVRPALLAQGFPRPVAALPAAQDIIVSIQSVTRTSAIPTVSHIARGLSLSI
jgi:hypothetical protein